MTRIRWSLFGLILLLQVMMPSLAYSQEPQPEPGPGFEQPAVAEPVAPGDGLPFGLPDPKQWAGEVFTQVLINLFKTISTALHKVVDGVLNSSLNFITQTPADGSYGSPTVQTLWGAVRGLANAALALVVLWGGFNLIVREHIGSPYHEAMELVPRVVLGALLANTSLSWAQLAIDANNALCQVVGQTSLPAWDRADNASQTLVDVIATLIYLITGLLLLLQMLMRLALIDILLVVAPLGLLCWVLPQTQSWARLWSGTFFAVVFTQFVQVLALKLGGSLLTELTPMAADAALLSVLLGIAVLALTLRIPGLMRGHIGDGLGFIRYYVYRQGARTLESRTGGAAPRTGGV
jgi:hypothetical protein